jgi:DNA topoisomerase-1
LLVFHTLAAQGQGMEEMPAKKWGLGPGFAEGATFRSVSKLVIVESPNKVKSIASYLGDEYVVDSSVGHIRDLPRGADEVPKAYSDKPWARLGVNIDGGFEPIYVVGSDKKKQITKLKKLLKGADELVLATDEDREGEAIAWHLLDELKPTVPVKRIVFNEITKSAVQNAIENPRDVDMCLVDAQETRRILDRLYGYEVSPVLWKKVGSGLSAGRVQSVATRLVVQRERERMAFTSAAYWDIEATFDAGAEHDPRSFAAKLVSVDGKRVATGKNFNSDGELVGADVAQLDETAARGLVEGLASRDFAVRSCESKPYSRKPYAPFRTTTLQREASGKFGFSPARTMQVAQRLYENGHITYMRTDSTTLSETALKAARSQVTELYGAEFLPDAPRVYGNSTAGAQEAHEAIRPSGERFRTPKELALGGDEAKLYELIWKRTVASQMKDAKGNTVSIRIGAQSAGGADAEFNASGRTITFAGFLKAYVEEAAEGDGGDDQQTRLPNLETGDAVSAEALEAVGHQTNPPSRFSEATLIKELEDRGIGRPSTYASIVATIQDRGYVYKKGTALVPAWLAFSVIRLLEDHFARLVNYDFTAELEAVLDQIAAGKEDRVEVLQSFWTGEGEGDTGLKRLISDLGEIDARANATFPLGEEINVRVGKFGPYLEGPPMVRNKEGEEVPTRANIPADLPPDELDLAKAKELLASPTGVDRELGLHPESGRMITAKNGRFGPYVVEALPEDAKKADKPRTASLFKSMDLDTVTLEEAVTLLSFPRTVGTGEDGAPITVQNGKYGPYLKKGTDSRTLTDDDPEAKMLTITEEEARQIYAQPKTYGRQKPPLKTFDEPDPNTGKPIVMKDGRFGPYVTDGETNASLRKADDVETITFDRAVELLADRRAAGPRKKKAPAKKKPAAKKKAAPKKKS